MSEYSLHHFIHRVYMTNFGAGGLQWLGSKHVCEVTSHGARKADSVIALLDVNPALTLSKFLINFSVP